VSAWSALYCSARNSPRVAIVAAIAGLIAGAAPARGQSPPSTNPSLPGSIDPGQIQQRLSPTPERDLAPEIAAPAMPGAGAPPGAANINFPLKRVVVEGASVYAEKDLAPLYAALLEKTVSLSDIYRVADAITAKYRGDGYILSQAVLPAQRIHDGEVRIRVVEGFIENVRFEGDRTLLLEKYGAIAMRARPLRAADLERALLLMNDLPGVSARGALSPSLGVTGGSDLIITVERRKFGRALSLDNRGTVYIGPLQMFAEVALNDVSGKSDRLGLRLITTPVRQSELRYIELDYRTPVGGNGGSFSFAMSWNGAAPGGVLQSDILDTRASGEMFTARLSHPVIRARRQTLSLDAAFAVRNSRLDQRDVTTGTRLLTSYEDRIREFRLGLTYDAVDEWRGRNFLRVDFVQGLPVLGASDGGRLMGASRPGGLTTFTKVSMDATRVQDLSMITPGLAVLAATAGGLSLGQPLLASSQFGVGGPQYGRGYDPAELTGDKMFSAKAEIQYDASARLDFVPGLGWLARAGDVRFVQFYQFFDFGMVWDQNPDLRGESARGRSAASAGGGLRTGIGGLFSASFEAAKPLTRGVAALAEQKDRKPFRYYFSIAANF
jgi:hemolysin activation/secretion protein